MLCEEGADGDDCEQGCYYPSLSGLALWFLSALLRLVIHSSFTCLCGLVFKLSCSFLGNAHDALELEPTTNNERQIF